MGLDSEQGRLSLMHSVPDSYKLSESRSGAPTLTAGEYMLHSAWDPRREAARMISDPSFPAGDILILEGSGLGYLASQTAEARPRCKLVLIEPDIYIFIRCLQATPLDTLFEHPDLILLIGLTPSDTLHCLKQLGLDGAAVFTPPALIAANPHWFSELHTLRYRSKKKDDINRNTLKRFGGLWLSNMTANLESIRDTADVSMLKDLFTDCPVLILAAGPSLDSILDILPLLARRMPVIAVDTACRACRRAGVEPDFCVLVDPQYWNFRHLDGQDTSRTILVSESAAWPGVFRMPWRETLLCSSLFPLGRFLEHRTQKRTELGAGGSVSTTAWDLARLTGTGRIIVAGLDLGFPELRTHAAGSVFEERTHTVSNRLAPSETAGFQALSAAGLFYGTNYRGTPVLTDKRLSLYAWWFESRIASCDHGATQTICPQGLMIPGITVADSTELLELPENRPEIDQRIRKLTESCAEYNRNDRKKREERFNQVLDELFVCLEKLLKASEDAAGIVHRAVQSGTGLSPAQSRRLDELDKEIYCNPAKEVAAMVFEQRATDANNADGLAILRVAEEMYQNIKESALKNLVLLKER